MVGKYLSKIFIIHVVKSFHDYKYHVQWSAKSPYESSFLQSYPLIAVNINNMQV